MNFILSFCAIFFPFFFIHLSIFIFYWAVFYFRFVYFKSKIKSPFFLFYFPIALIGGIIGLELFDLLSFNYYQDIRTEYAFPLQSLIGLGIFLGILTYAITLKRCFRFLRVIYELDNSENPKVNGILKKFIYAILGIFVILLFFFLIGYFKSPTVMGLMDGDKRLKELKTKNTDIPGK